MIGGGVIRQLSFYNFLHSSHPLNAQFLKTPALFLFVTPHFSQNAKAFGALHWEGSLT